MKTQLWWCEVCGTLGAVRHTDKADVMSVLHDQGAQHRKAAPLCSNHMMYLRSIVPENVKEPFTLTVIGKAKVSEER